jgi:hypothetical protein
MGKIYASDWNPIQSSIANIMGAPSGTAYGWNKASSVTSAQVNSTQQINHTHYNVLKDDINFCYTHITGSNSSLPIRNAGTQITQADLTNVAAAQSYISANKTTAAASQLTTSNIFSDTQAYTWTASLGATYTWSWSNATQFNAFWNAGGQIYWNTSRYGGSSTPQNQGWTNLLANSGFIYITATASGQVGATWAGTVYNTNGIGGFSTVPSIFTKVYDQDLNYTNNYYQTDVWLDAQAGNGATTMNLKISLIDTHVGTSGGPDGIDGNVALTITQKYPYTWAAGAATSSNGFLT